MVGALARAIMTQYSGYSEGNYLSVLRTIQKRMEATLGSIIFPRDRNLRQLYAHCALNTCLLSFSLCYYRASTIDKFSFKRCGLRHTWGLPRAWHKMMQWSRCTPGIWDSCTLIVLSIRAYILFSVPLSRFHASWAYSRSSYVNTALPLRLWRSWLCPRCCSDAFNCFTLDSCYDSTSAWPFQPVTLFLAERRPAALVLSLL